jgi:ABC-2 type transport system permease protein
MDGDGAEMSALDQARTIALVNMRLMLGDRRARFLVFVLPFGIILIVGLAVHGSQRLPVGLIDRSRGPLAHELDSRLAASRALRVHHYTSNDALDRAVRLGVEAGGVVLPTDYDARLARRQPTSVALLVDPTRRQSIAAGATVTAIVDRESSRVGGAVGLPTARVARARGSTTADPRGFDYTAPSNLVLFMFITSMAAAASVIRARQLGVTRRILGAPVSTATVLAGEALSRLLIALVQGGVIVVVGLLLFGIDWGDPLAVAALLVVFALVSTGAALLVGTLARTPEQALSVTPPIGIALGMLGGCMWPLSIVGGTLRTLGHALPHAWAMDAFIALIGHRAGIGTIGRELLVLTGFAVVLLVLSTVRLRRMLLAGAAH